MSYTREEMDAAARFEAEASRGLRCRCINGHHPGHTHSEPDPMNAAHIDVSVPAFGGSVRLRSASGGLEALWIDVRDGNGATVAYDRATGRHLAAAVRLTPSDARALAALLNRYADTHAETSDD